MGAMGVAGAMDLSKFDGHTPGPLQLRDGFDAVVLADPYAVTDAEGRVICWLPDVDTSTAESIDRFNADAETLRSAPSLLSELREARAELIDVRGQLNKALVREVNAERERDEARVECERLRGLLENVEAEIQNAIGQDDPTELEYDEESSVGILLGVELIREIRLALSGGGK